MKELSPKQFWLSISLIVVGSGLLIAGFTVPPLGAIHPSVLTAFGEILTFVGSVFGIDYHYKTIIYKHSNSTSNREKE